LQARPFRQHPPLGRPAQGVDHRAVIVAAWSADAAPTANRVHNCPTWVETNPFRSALARADAVWLRSAWRPKSIILPACHGSGVTVSSLSSLLLKIEIAASGAGGGNKTKKPLFCREFSAGRSQANNVLPATQSVGRVAEIASNPPDRLLSEVAAIVAASFDFVKLIVLIGLIR
jgi:hypothetical protein